MKRNKVFKIASDAKYDGYQRGLASMVYTSFLIKSLVEVVFLLYLQITLLLNQIINSQINFINKLLENSRDEKFIHPLETKLGLLIS